MVLEDAETVHVSESRGGMPWAPAFFFFGKPLLWKPRLSGHISACTESHESLPHCRDTFLTKAASGRKDLSWLTV